MTKSQWKWSGPRVGVINVCSKNNCFNDPREVIITSQMAVNEMVENVNEWPLGKILMELIML